MSQWLTVLAGSGYSSLCEDYFKLMIQETPVIRATGSLNSPVNWVKGKVSL